MDDPSAAVLRVSEQLRSVERELEVRLDAVRREFEPRIAEVHRLLKVAILDAARQFVASPDSEDERAAGLREPPPGEPPNVLDALRLRGAMTLGELAEFAFGMDTVGHRKAVSNRLSHYRRQGKVQTAARGTWKLSEQHEGAPGGAPDADTSNLEVPIE
jgi:hypothetical protein